MGAVFIPGPVCYNRRGGGGMQRKLAIGAAFAVLLCGTAVSLSAQTLPRSGELEKTDWSLKKEGLVAFLPAAAQAGAEVTAEKVAYAEVDLKKGLMSDGGQLLFTKSGALYRVEFVKIFNLEKENTVKTLQDTVAAVVDQYVNKLGKPDQDDSKSAEGKDSKVVLGSVVWLASAKRAVGPGLRFEVRFIASGNLVFLNEACTNTAVAPK
jgi:hypothetical protein